MANSDAGSGHAASGGQARHGREVSDSVLVESQGHTTPTSAKRARRRKSPLQNLREAEAAVEVERANAEKYRSVFGISAIAASEWGYATSPSLVPLCGPRISAPAACTHVASEIARPSPMQVAIFPLLSDREMLATCR